ncbi:MAG: ParB/RepB/Spo0J family partition protein [Firmicutes bacterium]|nr:ParB/RepB/Spo0J family partition protein [Bacillota bacterium]
MQRKSVGKGLSALMGEAEIEYGIKFEPKGVEVVDLKGGAALEIELDNIFANPNQPRKTFDENALMELTNSIRVHGVISPVVVVKSDNRFMLIAGERRYRAAKKAGLRRIPAIVRDYTEKQIKELSLIDNLQREDLNIIETASYIKELMAAYDYTQEEIAERIGKSRPYVTNILRLLTLTPEVKVLIAEDRLSVGHARCLVVVTDKVDQIRLALIGCDDKKSVREFEQLVKLHVHGKKEKIQTPQSLELRDLCETMKKTLKTKVTILGNDNKGRIFIDYFSRDDLERIREILLNN